MSEKIILESELEHYGILRKSGRYPWGSGSDPYQRGMAFYKMVDEMRAKGLTDKQIADAFELGGKPGSGKGTTTALKQTTSIARNEVRAADRAMAIRLRNKGMSGSEIAKRMNRNESSIRSLLDDDIAKKQDVLQSTVNVLRDQVNKNRFVDIGGGTELYLGISRDKLLTAVSILESEEPPYQRWYVNQDQLGIAGQKTTVMVLGKPDTTYPELIKDPTAIKVMGVYSEGKGEQFKLIKPPRPVDPSKIEVVYGPQGGGDRDGLIELRRDAPYLDMGHAKYAQVRILVDGDRFMKGMAVVSDDLPPGVDIRFNTPKKDTGNKLDAFKPIEDDPDNPFGSSIARQKTYIDNDGKEQLTALNIIREEGEWRPWSHDLSSQMMSKQPVEITKDQLNLMRDIRKDEFEEIKSLTNPTLKQDLLRALSEKLDADADNLKAMGLPRTRQAVILPVPEMKPTEVYAPGYKQGETVVLIRHPHGGIFEIPSLTVNNRNPAAKRMLGAQPQDAIGINAKVAEQLSGADFDGDTVLVIPNNDGRVKTSRPLEGLKNFDHRSMYKGFEGMKVMKNTQNEMGSISNLITDMTVQGAPSEDIAAAVRHSMVVIDAEKHKLNYKQSEIDNRIPSLKREYQVGGASTIISRAKADLRIPEVKGRPAAEGGPIDKTTGELKYVPTGKGYTVTRVNKRTGEVTEQFIPKTIKTTKMRGTSDARTLMSSPTGTPIERAYADHANALKQMANEARLEMINTPNLKRSPSAAKAYAPEVESLKRQLKTAQMNAPLERQAQVIGSVKANARIDANPLITKDQAKKIRTQELADARAKVGARKTPIDITPREWEAIQAGAIAHTPLSQILNHADPEQVKQYATPRDTPALSGPRLSRARSMLKRGFTQSEVAEALGVSVSLINELLKP